MTNESTEDKTGGAASGRDEPVVSVIMTEATADALHKLLLRVSIDEMQRRGLNYNESLLVSRIKPALY